MAFASYHYGTRLTLKECIMSRWRTWWNRLIRFREHKTTRPSSKVGRRHSTRLSVEALEDRCAPAILTVSNVLDQGEDRSLNLRQAIRLVNDPSLFNDPEFATARPNVD